MLLASDLRLSRDDECGLKTFAASRARTSRQDRARAPRWWRAGTCWWVRRSRGNLSAT